MNVARTVRSMLKINTPATIRSRPFSNSIDQPLATRSAVGG
jgi:hypothetical protein